MDHHMIPLLFIHEARLQLNEQTKHKVYIPTVEHHSIYNNETKLRIHLRLRGLLLYFNTRSLSRHTWKIGKNMMLSVLRQIPSSGILVVIGILRKRMPL